MPIVDDEDTQAIAKLVASATKLTVIRGLLNKIGNPILIRDALGDCAVRLREDGWRVDGPPPLNDVALLFACSGVESELAEAVFRKDRLDLIADELRLFIANHMSQRRKGQ